MTRKQLETRTKNAKMAGQEKRHFLNRAARHLKKLLGDIAGSTKLGFHLTEVPIGSASCPFHRHICVEECIYTFEGARTARIGATVLQVEAGDFTAHPVGSEARDLRNTGSSMLICVIVGQLLHFDIDDYPEQAWWLYCENGEKDGLITMA